MNDVKGVGPPEIYPRADLNPGFPNPDITQDNIADSELISLSVAELITAPRELAPKSSTRRQVVLR